MLVKKGSKGRHVKEIQTLLDFHGFWTYDKITDYFGGVTEAAVKEFQKDRKLTVDGAVGDQTLGELLEGVDADQYTIDDKPSYKFTNDTDGKIEYLGTYESKDGLTINKAYLDSDEYVRDYGKIEPKWFFIHHTAGGNDPYRTIRNWNNDSRGRVATQYCIGGVSRKGDDSVNGDVVECFPDNYIGWHLGKVGNFNMSKYSTAVEINNYGYLTKKDGKYYNAYKSEMPEDQVCDLGYEFKGYRYWHDYTDEQIESLRLLMKHIADIYPEVPIGEGIPKLLRDGVDPKEAFAFNSDAYNGKIHGTWSHTSVRKGKWDVYPHPKLVELLRSVG
jgi:N-acetyl-anhydromuramyl-L-alanine amidase AmpD